MKIKVLGFITAIFLFPMHANAVTLVTTSGSGFYNDSLGTLLNLSNSGVDDSSAYFPIFDDSSVNFAVAPDLTVVSSEIGDWLSNPGSLNANWTFRGEKK